MPCLTCWLIKSWLVFPEPGLNTAHCSINKSQHPYPVPAHFSGICEVTRDFPSGSCNRKLVGARHFAASAITRGIFNMTQDYASPFDGDGHGTHTASVAAGKHGIPVIVAGHHFGNASGMAPRSHIAVYKALYKSFGGFAADVVAAIDQAAQGGVDIISLSITPNRHPPGVATFFNPIDMALLSAVKAGIFVVQAAGNTGPSPMSMSSFSPWILTVGAASHDRLYSNSISLGNNVTKPHIKRMPTKTPSCCHETTCCHEELFRCRCIHAATTLLPRNPTNFPSTQHVASPRQPCQ
ncbi:subtilisin-like protease SBT2.2 [Lathyrus oleraceus]|uniref:subtilisin-like protease SBT2.2 n=1 Tax=Pisum sativum TaxID=3888 RepID=UPI0021CF5F2A|nr:subtilisin-like protease SBT2.2 [Pisum sativum]